MSWAQRLKRVFRIDIEHCERCGEKLKIIASIENPGVIERILAHLEQIAAVPAGLAPAYAARGPPRQGMLDLH